MQRSPKNEFSFSFLRKSTERTRPGFAKAEINLNDAVVAYNLNSLGLINHPNSKN